MFFVSARRWEGTQRGIQICYLGKTTQVQKHRIPLIKKKLFNTSIIECYYEGNSNIECFYFLLLLFILFLH